jgi:hypothetical protein
MLEDDLQTQFSGFYHTPHLFSEDILGMTPFATSIENTPQFSLEPIKNLRLGQRVERFVSQELNLKPNISILSENCQIQNGKQTIGELDGLYAIDNVPTHIEIQFKFYLYDESLGDTEIDRCIGPMRKDSLIEKLTKLKQKQLPLLFSKYTQPLLQQLQINEGSIKQKIYFKAQIYKPLNNNILFKTLNNNCVYGFYFNYKNLPQFSNCKFYKPKKVDWLVDVVPNTNWQTYEQILPQLKQYELEKYAPLLWLKKPNGELHKCFVVPW